MMLSLLDRSGWRLTKPRPRRVRDRIQLSLQCQSKLKVSRRLNSLWAAVHFNLFCLELIESLYIYCKSLVRIRDRPRNSLEKVRKSWKAKQSQKQMHWCAACFLCSVGSNGVAYHLLLFACKWESPAQVQTICMEICVGAGIQQSSGHLMLNCWCIRIEMQRWIKATYKLPNSCYCVHKQPRFL